MKKLIWGIIGVIVVGVIISAANKNKETNPQPGNNPPPANGNPKSAPSPKHATLVGLPLSPYQGMTSPGQAFDLMKSAGANFMEARKSWSSLEVSPGDVSFEREPLPFSLFEQARKSHPAILTEIVVTIAVVNTTYRSLPADVSEKAFDDPQVIARFNQIIEKLAEYAKKLPIKYVIVGHEADVYLTQHPGETAAFETFYKNVVDKVHSVMPGVEVGASMTFDGVKGNKTLVDAIQKHSDLVVYTYYPLDENFHMRPLDEVKSDLQLLADRAGDKKFAFLEIGYSASGLNGGSEDKQAKFVDTAFRALDPYRTSGQLKFLEYWMLFDFPPDLASQAAAAYGSSFKNDTFIAYLATLGLRHYDGGGVKRPGWDVFSSLANAWSQGEILPK